MQKKSIQEYYKSGTTVRYLLDAKQGFPIHSDRGIAYNLGLFFEYLDTLGLTVTKRLTGNLKDLLTELRATSNPSRLTGAQAAKLSREISEIRKTLGAELMGLNAFVVTPKILDTSKLLDDVPALFAPGVFNSLSEIARFDLTEAAHCIASNVQRQPLFIYCVGRRWSCEISTGAWSSRSGSSPLCGARLSLI